MFTSLMLKVLKLVKRKKKLTKEQKLLKLRKVLTKTETKFNKTFDIRKKHVVGMYGAYIAAKIEYIESLN